ncbi:hypothetical protein [Streptomyces luteocolor]|uniref:hypothetical protein n=1 Tax=Streptomyces luteocolor TaxID=285500 RepID=UPI0008536762|nr:hypothetical protein [Streptomyces luteocolor]
MTHSPADKALVFLASIGALSLAVLLFVFCAAAVYVVGDTVRHHLGRLTQGLRHRRIIRREAEHTDLDAALAHLMKENGR